MGRAHKVLLGGTARGVGNLGDEAIIASIIRSLHRIDPEVESIVLSRTPKATTAMHGAQAVAARGLGALKAIRNCDLFIAAGGTLITDWYRIGPLRGNIPNAASQAFAARLFGKPAAWIGIGAEPLRTAYGRFLARSALNLARSVSVRDVESKSVLKDIGVSRPSVRVTGDPALLLEPCDPREALAVLGASGLDGADRPLVGVSVCRYYESRASHHPANLAKVCQHILEKWNAAVVFILTELRPWEDLSLVREIMDRMRGPGKVHVLVPHCTPHQLLGVIGRLSFSIGMRLHFLIFNAMMGVPFVGIAYSAKVENFLRSLGMRSARCASEQDLDELICEVESMWERKDEVRRALGEKVKGLKAQSLCNEEELRRFLSCQSV